MGEKKKFGIRKICLTCGGDAKYCRHNNSVEVGNTGKKRFDWRYR